MPSQVSGLSQSLLPELPHEVPGGSKRSGGHAPDVPVQFSATSHWPAEARQTVLEDRKTSTHTLLVPVQWSAASLSHAPPCEAPVHRVDEEAKASVGHAP